MNKVGRERQREREKEREREIGNVFFIKTNSFIY